MRQSYSFLEKFDVWGTFVMTNLAWIVFSFPIITIPVATAGLFNVMSRWVRGKQPEFFHDFFGGIGRYWVKAVIIGLLDVLVGGIVLLNMRILLLTDTANPITLISSTMTFFAGLALLLLNLYIWSLLVLFDQSLWHIIQSSAKLVIVHPFWSIGVLIAAVVPILISLVLPRAIFLFGTISLSALIINKGTWHIIRRYVPEEELKLLEASENLVKDET